MELAGSGLFRPRWSDAIHDEWIRSLLKKRPDLTEAQLVRTRQMMDDSVLGCVVAGFESLIPALFLPDANDRHVLAAAIHCGADAIVTFNLKDFPTKTAAEHELEIIHPDDFLHQQFGLDPAAVVIAARNCRARLKKPAVQAAAYLDILEGQALPQLVGELRAFADVI